MSKCPRIEDFDNGDECRVEMVDGEPVQVIANGSWTQEDRDYFAEIVRAAKAHVTAIRNEKKT